MNCILCNNPYFEYSHSILMCAQCSVEHYTSRYDGQVEITISIPDKTNYKYEIFIDVEAGCTHIVHPGYMEPMLSYDYILSAEELKKWTVERIENLILLK